MSREEVDMDWRYTHVPTLSKLKIQFNSTVKIDFIVVKTDFIITKTHFTKGHLKQIS